VTQAPHRPLRIAVADDEADTRQFLKEVLTRLGHEVVAAEDGRRLVEICRTTRPDLIVTDVRMPEATGLEAAAAANQDLPVPVVLITGHPEADLLQGEGGYVMACLSKPVKPADLIAAITLARKRFEHFQQLAKEAAGLRQALEDRKLIERAKGIAMKRLRVDEEEAFRRLQRAASESNSKLVEVARQLVAADDIFQRLDRV
jgi:AmiR/NasT family two-component response regulator